MFSISVIVPVYNVEKYIGDCIESILNQTYKDFELLLIDDGSSDRSGLICKEYAQKDPRIRVFHKENGGVSSARNMGLSKAQGSWLCFVDSDDSIDKTYLEDFGLGASESDFYLQGYKTVCNDRILKIIDFGGLHSNEFSSILAYAEDNNIINSPCFKLYNREIVASKNMLFDLNTSYGEDHLFSLQYVMNITSIHYSNNSGYNYTVKEGSLTHSIKPYNQLSYYTIKAREYGLAILSKNCDKDFLQASNRRLFNNLRVFVFDFFLAGESYDLYKKAINRFKEAFYEYKDGLSHYGKLFMFLLLRMPAFFSFNCFKLYIRLR